MLSLCKSSFKIFSPNTRVTKVVSYAERMFKTPRKQTMTLLHVYAYRNNSLATSLSLLLGLSPSSPSFPHTPLHIAAALRHTDVARVLLAHGAQVNAADSKGFSPLHFAVQYLGTGRNRIEGEWEERRKARTREMIILLLQHGADVNFCDKRGATPLFYVSVLGLFVMELLLQCGGDLMYENKNGESVIETIALYYDTKFVCSLGLIYKKYGVDFQLHKAAEIGNVEEVRRLAGTNKLQLEKFRADGLAPIHVAAMRGHIEVVEELVKLGTDVDLVNTSGKTALHFAVHSSVKLIEALLRLGADVHIADDYDKTPLFEAVEANKLDHVDILLKAGSRLDTRDYKHNTTLHYVKSVAVLDLLITAGAHIRWVNMSTDDTVLHTAKNGAIAKYILQRAPTLLHELNYQYLLPLHQACATNNKEVVEVLLDAGSQVNPMVDGYKLGTPLMLAVRGAWNDNCDLMRLLLQRGADVEETNGFNDDALYIAASRGNVHAIKLLLQQGVSVTKRDGALFGAVYKGSFPATKLLLEYGADLHHFAINILSVACRTDNVDLITLLLEHGAKVNGRARTTKKAPLHVAARKGRVAALKELLKKGAKVNAKTVSHNTALHLACLHGRDEKTKEKKGRIERVRERAYVEVVRALVQAGADVNARNNMGETPLHRVRSEKVAKELETEELSAHEKDNSGKTPLHVAVEMGCVEMVRFLLDVAPISREDARFFLSVAESQEDVSTEKVLREWLLAHKGSKQKQKQQNNRQNNNLSNNLMTNLYNIS